MTKLAVEGLDGLEIQEKPLRISEDINSSVRQNVVQQQGQEGGLNVAAVAAAGVPMHLGDDSVKNNEKENQASQKICEKMVVKVGFWINMVTKEELEDDEEYEDIMEDIKGECEKMEHLSKLKCRGLDHACKTFLEYHSRT